MNDDELTQLQDWYASHTNGEWEHGYGIVIESLDNPGWHVKIELNDTNLESKPFRTINVKHSKIDWYGCKLDKSEFHGYASQQHLTTLLRIFNDWAHKYPSSNN
jgi:hypothetical protein